MEHPQISDRFVLKMLGKSENHPKMMVYHGFPIIFPAFSQDLQRAWPVLLRCLRGGEKLAARAVALAALSKAPAWELLTAALEAFEAGGPPVG